MNHDETLKLSAALQKQLPEDWLVWVESVTDIPHSVQLIVESPKVKVEINCRLGKNKTISVAKAVAWSQRIAKQIIAEVKRLRIEEKK